MVRVRTEHPIVNILRKIGLPFYWLLTFTLVILSLFLSTLLKTKLPRFRFILLPCLLFVFIFMLYSVYQILFKDLPRPDKLLTRSPVLTTKIYDRNDQLLYKIYRNQNRTIVQLDDLPLSLLQATIAVEDAEFYNHHGLSLRGIVRAATTNIQTGELTGGSTITQQLIKNTLLTSEKTWRRKLQEMILAFQVEMRFSKDEILQMYLNEVSYGGSTYGIEEASWAHFNKSAKNLTLAESAFLAGLPASPTTFSPYGAHPELATERQKLVLSRMQQEGYINEEQEQQALTQQLVLFPPNIDIQAPHFVMYIKELLTQEYGERMVEEGGLEVKTSLDLNIQNHAQQIVQNEIKQLHSLHINNGAALVTNPQTGQILAMVGSADYFDLKNDGNVNVTTRLRQPGSSIKPVTYSLALASSFTAASLIPDTPISYQTPGQPTYAPHNYDNRYHGNVTLRTALGSSYNIPAVKVLSALGVNQMISQAQKMGITTWNDPSRFGLSLTLGGGDVTMIDMATVYGTLANLGNRVDLHPILEVKNYRGEILSPTPNTGSPTPVIDPKIAFIITDILADNSARQPAFGPRSWLNIANHPHVAVKTGTTTSLRDNWTIGYTPDYVVTVWVGNNDNSPMSYVASGITGASPIWNKIFTFLLANKPGKEFPKPEGLVNVEICPYTFSLSCNNCPKKTEYFLPGTEPKSHCDPAKVTETIAATQNPKPL